MTTVRAFRPTCARKCSSRSFGSTTPATRTRVVPGLALRSPATSPARMAGTSRLATVRWAACAARCGFRCDIQGAWCRPVPLACAKRRLLRQQALEFFRVLDVELEAAGHHNIAGLLVGLAGPQPFRLDRGDDILRQAGDRAIAMCGGLDGIGRIEI